MTTPTGVARLAPWIISADTLAEIAFLEAVFGAVEQPGSRFMAGDHVGHAEIELAGAAVLMFDAGADWPPTPSHMRVYVADVRGTIETAVTAGATVVTPPSPMPFGDVIARFRDPQGHLWWVHEHVEDVDAAELTRRFADPAAMREMAAVGESLVEDMRRGRAERDRLASTLVRFFYDCEFIEDGVTIDLVSIGVVAEDGREFYAVSTEFDAGRAGRWVRANVLPKLPSPADPAWRSRTRLRDDLLAFLTSGPGEVELWAWVAAYDHVALCQLWGDMTALPRALPRFTRELRQRWDEAGRPALPPPAADAHDALADARLNLRRWEAIQAAAGV